MMTNHLHSQLFFVNNEFKFDTPITVHLTTAVLHYNNFC